jgi:pilus assembly protein CpaF
MQTEVSILLEQALNDSSICEVIVNGKELWVDGANGLVKMSSDLNAEQMENFIRNSLSKVGRKIDRRLPLVDARLSDGSRLAVVGEPAVLGGLHFCIRKFPQNRFTLSDLIKNEALTENSATIINDLIRERANILIAGATGSGKTTLLNAIASQVADNERIIVLEDTAELAITHPHVVRLECRPPNIEGEGEIGLQLLLRACLRMRPDRIIVGECRGKEALDLLQALHTGHAGSMATIHANSARDALARLELLAASGAANLQQEQLQQYVAAGIQAVIFLEKEKGVRKVKGIFRLAGLEGRTYLMRRLDMN